MCRREIPCLTRKVIKPNRELHIDFKISPESSISRLQIGKNRVFNFKIRN